MTQIDDASARLDRALSRLEAAISSLMESSGDQSLLRRELYTHMEDRARLAEELDAALARERELQALAEEASAALGAAIEDVRAAIDREG